jgi:alpha-tubulin suppressor-like RCC1 family protein
MMKVKQKKMYLLLMFKLGNNHVLALSENGEVYGWGDNSKYQVGVCKNGKLKKKPKNLRALHSTIWIPVKVYPPSKMSASNYNKAIQIVAYNDTSFILTTGRYA